MGDPVDIIKDVGLNLVTGGLYSIGKGIYDTATTGDPMHLLGQGFDVGLAAVGNSVAVDIGGPIAGMAYNIAGATAGLAGGGVAGLEPVGFGTAEAGTAPLATTAAAEVGAGTGAVPLASGVPGSTTAAETGAASLTGTVSPTVAAPAAESTAPGGLANMVGAGESSAPKGLTGLPTVATNATAAPETAGYLGEIGSKANSLEQLGAKGFWASLSPGAQTALITAGMVGGQTITGGMAGLFAGASAQQKLELEQLINAQYQQQIQYKNRNNSYAPLLTFKPSGPGLANTPIPPTVTPPTGA